MSNLTISDLFTPAPSGVNAGNPNAPVPDGSWLATLLYIGTTVGLQTTQWQAGGITRSQLAMLATGLASSDQIVSVMAQGGFLDWAAAVTKDPSTLTGAALAAWTPGWLDKLAATDFNAPRELATYASGSIVFTNSGASSLGPFSPGTFHVANPTTGATYHNVNSLTIPVGTSTGQEFIADLAGQGSSSGAGTITSLVTTLVHVSCTNPTALIGGAAESNAALVARCRLKQGSLSPNGPEFAYEYFALTALQVLQAINPNVILRNGAITRTIAQSNTTTGSVDVLIANAAAATDGVVSVPVLGATNASPIVLELQGDITGSMTDGDWLFVAGVEGNAGANGLHQIASHTVTMGNTFLTLEATSAGTGAYTTGGTAEVGDLGLVDYVLQANVVPLAITETTAWAGETSITVVVVAYVPASQAGTAASTIQTAIATFFASVPIGGFTTGVPTPNTLPISGLEVAIGVAAPYIQDLSVTLNGSTTDIPLPSSNIPTINGGSATVTIIPF